MALAVGNFGCQVVDLGSPGNAYMLQQTFFKIQHKKQLKAKASRPVSSSRKSSKPSKNNRNKEMPKAAKAAKAQN